MPAIGVHHTETTDVPWDGGANEARLSNEAGEATYGRMYAWQNPEGDADTKAAFKFPHHQVSDDGVPGPANLGACRNIKARVPQATIPPADDEGVNAHAQAHLDDAPEATATSELPATVADGSLSVIAPHGYTHVTKAIYEKPWAVQRQMLTFMAGFISYRAQGGALTSEQIEQRLAAVRAEQGPRDGAQREGSVAVIPMYGLLSQRMSLMSEMSGGTSMAELRSSLATALRDPQVSAVVFDIDSAGGATDGLPEFAAELRALRSGRIPIVAQVNTLAASAAYWLASSMSEIVVTPSGEVGSIGIFAVHEDYSKAAEMAGVRTTLISAGRFKTEGNEFEPLTDEAKAAIQEQVQAFYQMFVSDVAKGRGVSVESVATDYGEGRTFLATKALRAGMVDRIDTLEGTVRRLQGAPPRRAGRAALTSIPAPAAAAAQDSRADPAWNAAFAAKHPQRSKTA